MSWEKLHNAYMKSTNLFHQKVTPNLPIEIQEHINKCETLSIYTEGKEHKVMLDVNNEVFDITEWYVPNITIFDVYE